MERLKQLGVRRLGIYYLSREQKLLLQAAGLQGQAGINAWEEWQDLVDIEDLDPASNALLCQLYRNLVANQVQHRHLAKLKGIYKRNWYSNQLQWQKLQSIIAALSSKQIEAMVLDEIALTEQYDRDRGSRPLHQINLLIQPEQLELAIAILEQLGWKSTSEKTSSTDLWLRFEDNAGTRLCLWGNLFHDSLFPAVCVAKQLGKDAVPCDIGGGTTSLSPSNSLLRLSTRIFQRDSHVQLIPLLDAMTVCKHESIDWIDAIAKAQSYRCILPLRNLLLLLEQLYGLEVPPWVISALYQIPPSNVELLKYQVLATNKKTLLKSWLVQPLADLKTAIYRFNTN